MAHNRKIVLSGTSMTMARLNRLKDYEVAPEIMDEMERLMLSTGYLNSAPFKWVGLSLRYGLKNEGKPHYQGIDDKDGEIALAIELDTHDLQHATREELKELFMIATLKTLVHVARQYSLPGEAFEALLEALFKERHSRQLHTP
jgi:Immunity protein 39